MGYFGREFLDEFDGDAGFLRSAGTGRDDDALWLAAIDFLNGDAVVAMDLEFATEFAEILGEVVGEGIVVVEKENHERRFPFRRARRWVRGAWRWADSRARRRALALFSDSRNSPRGVESATMPPPA